MSLPGERSTFVADIVYLIEQAGKGTYGLTIFKGTKAKLPELTKPRDVRRIITIVRTGGGGEAGTHNDSRSGIAYERPSCQITVRAVDADDAEAGAEDLKELLKFTDTKVNGCFWRFSRPGDIIDLGSDLKGFPRFAFNLTSERRVSPASS